MERVTLFPNWRQAVHDFMESDPQPGAIISKAWLLQAFEIAKPVTAEDQKKADLDFLQHFTQFRNQLLEEHCIDLKAIPGQGYMVVPPKDQTRLAVATRMKNIRREMASMVKQISFVRLDALTDEERRENADAQAKAAQLRAMVSAARIAPKPLCVSADEPE